MFSLPAIPPTPSEKNDSMAEANDAEPVFYPAFCFKASPTHFTWVKMAAADVHRLQRVRGFEGMLMMLDDFSLLYSSQLAHRRVFVLVACYCANLSQSPSCQSASGYRLPAISLNPFVPGKVLLALCCFLLFLLSREQMGSKLHSSGYLLNFLR